MDAVRCAGPAGDRRGRRPGAFVSGATEGIQTAVLSAMTALRERSASGAGAAATVLYGATEHKAVPEAIRHWNHLPRLGLGRSWRFRWTHRGRHDLDWLVRPRAPGAGWKMMARQQRDRRHQRPAGHRAEAARQPGLLDGRWRAGAGQASTCGCTNWPSTGATFGHKLYAPTGIGLLYVRQGAPVTPLLAGGGQRMRCVPAPRTCPASPHWARCCRHWPGAGCSSSRTPCTTANVLAQALRDAFPDIVFNAPPT